MENKTREAIRFEGSVQGVGFRYRMSQLARHFRALLGAAARWCCETQLQNGVEEGNILYRKTAVRMRTHRP